MQRSRLVLLLVASLLLGPRLAAAQVELPNPDPLPPAAAHHPERSDREARRTPVVRAVESLAELRLESTAAAAKAAATKADPSSVFVGRYSDPDSPGGTRVISLEQGAGTPSLGSFKRA